MMLGLNPYTSNKAVHNVDGAVALAHLSQSFSRGGDRGSVGCEATFSPGNFEITKSIALEKAVRRHRNTVHFVDGTAAGVAQLIQAKKGDLKSLKVEGDQTTSLLSRWARGGEKPMPMATIWLVTRMTIRTRQSGPTLGSPCLPTVTLGRSLPKY